MSDEEYEIVFEADDELLQEIGDLKKQIKSQGELINCVINQIDELKNLLK